MPVWILIVHISGLPPQQAIARPFETREACEAVRQATWWRVTSFVGRDECVEVMR